jgi:hypothetical protein
MRIGFAARVAALAALLAWVSCAPRPRAAPLEVPRVLIVGDDTADNDLDLKAYGEVFDSVSLAWKRIPPAHLAAVRDALPGLILAVPAAAARTLDARQIQDITGAVHSGATLITEEITPLSQALGFRAGPDRTVQDAEELAYPDVEIHWQRPVKVTSPVLPDGALLLNRSRSGQIPLAALVSRGRGKCLFLAAPLDPEFGEGYKRFPYLPQQLMQAGVVFPFRSERLAALFDYGYRVKADLEALARRWRSSGISSLHVGAWDFFDPDGDKTGYLKKLIQACHQNGILVYAWLEWPHVSESFWKRHPQWRETTALGRDAEVDWRLLMNLEDPDCFRAATKGLRELLVGFDFDGVDIAELYFESTAGPASPEEFTPLNRQIRRDYRSRSGIDPMDFFQKHSPLYWKRNAAAWKQFVDYRVELERSLNQRVLDFLAGLRRTAKPSLALILLYVDNIYDPAMREGVGADLKVMLPLLEQYDFTLVMEDPWTVWHLGPRRYAELAKSYARLTRKTDRLGIDINIVERAQEVFPTQQQTGSEFLQLLHYAGQHFPTVMVYAEQTPYPQDLELVPYALASGASAETVGRALVVHSERPVICHLNNSGRVFVDGKPWPAVSADGVLLPKGTHEVAIGQGSGPGKPRLIRFNGTLLDARYLGQQAIEFSYESEARAIALFDRPVRLLQFDGGGGGGSGPDWAMLPAGRHRIRALF